MAKNGITGSQAQLRELASRTLEAYRTLNTAAAEASYSANRRANGDSLARAGELLESVVSEIKGAASAKDG